jgi:hypothetical protein
MLLGVPPTPTVVTVVLVAVSMTVRVLPVALPT